MPSKRRRISDLIAVDANELLLKLDEFRAGLDDEGDEDLPANFIDKLEELRDKLQDTKRTHFSKVDPMTLLSLKISSGPLFLISEKRQEIEGLGLAEATGCIGILWSLCSTAWFIRTPKTEAGCRILINILLLRVVSVVCPGEMTVNIIPEFPLPRTTFKQDSGKYSFSGVVDFLVTKLPAWYTEYLLGDPMTSNIFEAKRDNVRIALPQAAIATASYCQLQNLTFMLAYLPSGVLSPAENNSVLRIRKAHGWNWASPILSRVQPKLAKAKSEVVPASSHKRSIPVHPAEYDLSDEENLPSPFLRRTERERAVIPSSGSFKSKRPSTGNLLRVVAAANSAAAAAGMKPGGKALSSKVSSSSLGGARPSSTNAKKLSSRS